MHGHAKGAASVVHGRAHGTRGARHSVEAKSRRPRKPVVTTPLLSPSHGLPLPPFPSLILPSPHHHHHHHHATAAVVHHGCGVALVLSFSHRDSARQAPGQVGLALPTESPVFSFVGVFVFLGTQWSRLGTGGRALAVHGMPSHPLPSGWHCSLCACGVPLVPACLASGPCPQCQCRGRAAGS